MGCLQLESKYEIVCSDYDSKFKIDERVIQAYTKVVIEEALEKNDKAMLGLIIQSSVYDYWEGKAVSQADEEEADGDL